MDNIIKPVVIGNVSLTSNLVLAPLAGFTDAAFRKLCKDEGAALTVTEMVSVKGLCYANENTAGLLAVSKNEVPSCVQLFGSDPEFFVKALGLPVLQGFDIIDINMGCPMKKVVKNGDGSALLKTPALAARIVDGVSKMGKTVTVKMRIGWDKSSINAVGFAKAMEDSGASAITVHGRTTEQLYAGSADWDTIGEVAASVKIPVLGNGDVKSREDAADKMLTYKTAGVMIGRGALGNPQIFNPENKAKDVLGTILKHLSFMEEFFPAKYIVMNFRKHIPYYLKGFKGMKELKNELNAISDYERFKAKIIETFTR